MREKTKSTKASRQRHLYIKATCVGVGSGLLIYLIILLTFSIIFTLQDMPEMATLPVGIVALVAGSYLAGYITCKMTHRKGAVLGALCGGILFLMVFITNLIVNHSQPFSGLFFTKLLIVLLSAIIGGVVGANSKKRRV
ncbi:TIGR04086 family membrane protein [Candidatus Soleaferrea massiliensis]|uniref:TIGR04086 family membrane protein n=1 Tax=Candidatus Soleaferrea massiliensis TaxID=1470354 RepID=UPI000693D1FF|nr:TIGR04086 family membrane protein [Candidatus Soleaferrea massiliensis]